MELRVREAYRTEQIWANDYGQVAAGQVVDFIPRGKRLIVRPRNAARTDDLITLTVCGDSLISDGINDGDRLTCRLNFELSELKNGKLVVVKLPCGGLTVKHIHYLENGFVKLYGANPKCHDQYFEWDMIEVKAIVVESAKRWD